MASKAKVNRWVTKEGDDIPLVPRPELITIIVAGGDQSGHAYWMQVGSTQYRTGSSEVKLPSSWQKLLDQAETDLGPAPAR
jgi:hypothetical protein